MLLAVFWTLTDAVVGEDTTYPSLARYLWVGTVQRRVLYAFNCTVGELAATPVSVVLTDAAKRRH